MERIPVKKPLGTLVRHEDEIHAENDRAEAEKKRIPFAKMEPRQKMICGIAYAFHYAMVLGTPISFTFALVLFSASAFIVGLLFLILGTFGRLVWTSMLHPDEIGMFEDPSHRLLAVKHAFMERRE